MPLTLFRPKKLIKIDSYENEFSKPVIECKLGKDVVYFVCEHNVWSQYVKGSDGRLMWAHPDDRPLVYFIDDFLNSDQKEMDVIRAKKGVYLPPEKK